MVTIKTNLKSIISITAVKLLLLSTNAFVFAKTTIESVDETVINGVSGGPGFVSIHAREFNPTVGDSIWYYAEDELYPGSTTTGGLFQAGLNVPHGATLTKIVLYYFDNSRDVDFSVSVSRKPLSGGISQSVASVSSWYDDGYGYRATTAMNYPQIDLQNYAYFVKVSFPYPMNEGSDLRLVGVRVDYGYNTYLSEINN